MRFALALSAGLLLALGASASAGPTKKQIPLTTQDVPRSFLAELGAQLLDPDEVGTKGVGVPFIFPDDAKQGSVEKTPIVYGIDLSHHNFPKGTNYDLPNLDKKLVAFVYMKASQGDTYFDPFFKKNWGQIKVLKGGYHFLSARVDPVAQADNFIGQLSAVGYKAGHDLAPVLDLEWDCSAIVNSKCVHDYWSDLSRDEIIRRITAASERIKAKLGIEPLYYSNAYWISSVGLGDTDFAKSAKWWLNDFTKKSQNAGKPQVPAGVTPLLWQFTENGKLVPSCNPLSLKSLCTDTNRVMLPLDSFKSAMGVAAK
jgi:lysozyme